MSCTNFDWKAYVLNELTAAERPLHEQHLSGCESCREECEGVQLTTVLLTRLPQAEPPRRIAFISDPVMEPAWWRKLLTPGPRWVFAASCLLSASILAHGYLSRPSVDVDQRIAEIRQEYAVQRAQDLNQFKGTLEYMERQMTSVMVNASRAGGD
jgi:hypothetical protein